MIPPFMCDLCYKGPNNRNICDLNIDYYNPYHCKYCDIQGVPVEIDVENNSLFLFYSGKSLFISDVGEDISLLTNLIIKERRRIIF